MNQQTMRNLTLFELLARSWDVPAAVETVCFSADGSVAAFACADGGVALARLADPEPPEERIRVSADLGQATIRPRTHRPEALVATGSLHDRAPVVVPAGGSGFLLATRSGVLRLAADSTLAAAPPALDGPVHALDHAAGTGMTAAANGAEVVLSDSAGAARRLSHPSAQGVTALAFSPAGERIASAAGDRLGIGAATGEAAPRHLIDIPAPATGLRWSADGRWLACLLESGGFVLVETDSGRSGTVSGFPTPVRSVAWSVPGKALLASGAFRIAGWSIQAPPLEDTRAGAIVTGRSGLVAVEAVAAHPKRPLAAAGYANGQVVVAQVGARDELLVRPSGGSITALAWSADGRHLAAGTADGSASLVTFPPQLFK